MKPEENIIDLSDEYIGHEVKPDWRDFPTRNRNALIVTLCEGDVLVDGDEYNHVTIGEINIYADGAVDMSHGEMQPVSIEGVQDALLAGKTIFNMEETNA